jgi:CHAD domain-containing protein
LSFLFAQVYFPMPMDRERSRPVFQKLGRQLSKLEAKTAPQNVHKFRTASRRVEVLLEEFVAAPDRNQEKLLRLLARLRRKAGRVRDLDVQISALRSLKIPQELTRKSQLLRQLADERARREHRLAKAFSKEKVRELRRRLKRAARKPETREKDALNLAMRPLAELGRAPGPLTEKLLHQYRIAGKRARYLAELGGNDAAAQRLVEQLKRMQDVIGDWQDWLKLTQRVEKLLAGAQESPLMNALHNVTRAKFRQAFDALSETRAGLASKRPVSAFLARGRGPSEPAVAAVA